jgi:anti-sigma factor RsiW
MMKTSCEEFAKQLVDYVDSELPEGDAQRVARHLDACESCRRMAQALQRSLGLAEVIWSENLGDRQPARTTSLRKLRRVGSYAVAASILIVVSILMLSISDRHPQQRSIPFEEVERQIDRAGIASQLLAATRIVAQVEGMESVVESQYKYILQEYAGTPAAESVRAVLGSSLGGIQ